MATQYFKRNLPLNLYREGKKYCQFVSSCRLREIKMSNTCRLFPPFGDPWLPACYPLIFMDSSPQVLVYKDCEKFVLSSSLRIPDPSLLGDPQIFYQPAQEMTLSTGNQLSSLVVVFPCQVQFSSSRICRNVSAVLYSFLFYQAHHIFQGLHSKSKRVNICSTAAVSKLRTDRISSNRPGEETF